MTHQKRYTAEEMKHRISFLPSKTWEDIQVINMLRQAAEAESEAAGLVEAAYREGFRDGMVDSVADESGLGGIGEDAYWSGSKSREALEGEGK